MRDQIILYIIALFIRLLFFFNQAKGSFLEISFLDVGQGDSILVTTPNKKRVLIDGGEGFTVDHLLNSYFPLNNCRLDVVILTHAHADHLEGLYRVLDHCKVDYVFSNSVDYDSELYKNWELKLNKLEEEGIVSVRGFLAGEKIKIDNVSFYCAWPREKDLTAYSNLNNTSIVIFLDYSEFEAFLPGDAEEEVLMEVEKEMAKYSYFLDGPLEVYKASHHGSENGLIRSLWKDLNPVVSVIPVGEDNKFGHPVGSVIEFFAKENALMKRTDLDGTIKIRYNSVNYEWNAE